MKKPTPENPGSPVLLKFVGVFAALLLASFTGAGLYLSQGKELGERHEPYQPEASFDFEDGSYDEYIAYSRNLIRAARVDSPSKETIANLSPFKLEPGAGCQRRPDGKHANGIVLTHGLIDSPYSMRPLGEFFRARCFLVLGILIPGHGTRPGDMLTSTWEEWAAAKHFATRLLEQQVENIYLAGHSAGGTLAVLEAATNPAVDALILFAPALKISDAAKYARLVTPIGQVFPKAAWLGVEADEAVYRYESFPAAAAEETYALIQRTHRALAERPLEIPIMTVASMQDNAIDVNAILNFMETYSHPIDKTLLYSQHPVTMPETVTVKIGNAEQEDILSLSHLGLMTPPSHPYYGRNGAYRNCGYYLYRPGDAYQLCKAGRRDFYGEPNGENLRRGIVERIAFNPFYDELLEEISAFIGGVTDFR